VAEQLVLEAGRRGLPVRVYRPGTLSGDSASGATNSYDLLNAVVVESLNLAAAPSIPGWLLEMTPVDFVAKAIVSIASRAGGGDGGGDAADTTLARLNGTNIFHLGDARPAPADRVFGMLANLGYPVELVPFDEWTERWAEQRGSAANVGDDAFTTDVLKGGMPTAEGLKAVPVISDVLTAPVLKDLGLHRPAIDVALLETYARHFYSVGWLSYPPAAHLRRPLPSHPRRASASTASDDAADKTTTTSSRASTPPPTPRKGPLTGRIALVTGASSGIGAAVSAALAAAGASVALGARRLPELEAVRDAILRQTPHARVLLCQTDVTDLAQVERLAKEAAAGLGPVDTVVACAGIMYYTMMANAKTDQWARTVDVNCKGLLNTLACTVPVIVSRNASTSASASAKTNNHPRGHIVAISSDAGRKVFPGLGVYSASKFFVEATLQALRLETAGTGLRVTSVQPGNVETPLQHMSTDREALEKFAGLPVPGEKGAKFLAPEEVARAIVWALDQPDHVAVNEVLIEPREQPI
jgi:NADP-dependent 3-hydroxy acid dehydrogenase YdfG